MAEQRLAPETLEEVDRACEVYERKRTGEGGHERLLALAQELVARHAPSLAGGDEAGEGQASHW
jgi:hypothetical protein